MFALLASAIRITSQQITYRRPPKIVDYIRQAGKKRIFLTENEIPISLTRLYAQCYPRNRKGNSVCPRKEESF